jgi:hypothetical protein
MQLFFLPNTGRYSIASIWSRRPSDWEECTYRQRRAFCPKSMSSKSNAYRASLTTLYVVTCMTLLWRTYVAIQVVVIRGCNYQGSGSIVRLIWQDSWAAVVDVLLIMLLAIYAMSHFVLPIILGR